MEDRMGRQGIAHVRTGAPSTLKRCRRSDNGRVGEEQKQIRCGMHKIRRECDNSHNNNNKKNNLKSNWMRSNESV